VNGFFFFERNMKMQVRTASRLVAIIIAGIVVAGLLVKRLAPNEDQIAHQNALVATGKDQYGDPLPQRAHMRLGTSRFRHSDSIYAIPAYSPDGTMIATGSAGPRLSDASAAVWEAASGKQIHLWTGHAHVVRSVAFSPDNKQVVAVNGYGKVHIYDVASGKELHRLETDSPEQAMFTPDGTTLLVADGKNVRRWNLISGKEIEPLRGHEWRIMALCVNGTLIATTSIDQTVRLWDAEGRELRRISIPHNGLGVAFSPDGTLLACGSSGEEIYVWDTAGQLIWREKTGSWRISPQAFSPDGKTLVSGGNALRIWDAVKGTQIRAIEGAMGTASFSPRGREIASLGEEATLHFWDPFTGKEIMAYEGHHHAIVYGAFSPDGKTLMTVSDEPFVRLWDLTTGKARQFASELKPLRIAAFSPDGKTLVTSSSSDYPSLDMGLWDLSTGQLLRRFVPLKHDASGNYVAFSANGSVLASNSRDCIIYFWDMTTGEEMPQKFVGSISRLSSNFFHRLNFALAPDGKSVATTRESNTHSGVILWDIASGKEQIKLSNAGKPATFSPDGRLVAILWDKNSTDVTLVDAVAGKETQRIQGDSACVRCAAFSPDGKTIATAGDNGIVYLWEVATGQRRDRLIGHKGPIRFVAFAPNGLQLASGGEDHTVLIWDLTSEAPDRNKAD